MEKFTSIKSNKPIGSVKIKRVHSSQLHICDCNPLSFKPCSTEDCLNRALQYECNPKICPAGKQCQNQFFAKRKYPKQELMPCGDRGWGLRTGLGTIVKKGEFINEYVGELIDNEECKRRLKVAKENDITNFYFLQLDANRVIDAGPKGNLARFINHSCDPNLEARKWEVNGDIRIGLFAVTDIPEETELTFNYDLECMVGQRTPCKCGAKNCKGFIENCPRNKRSTSH